MVAKAKTQHPIRAVSAPELTLTLFAPSCRLWKTDTVNLLGFYPAKWTEKWSVATRGLKFE